MPLYAILVMLFVGSASLMSLLAYVLINRKSVVQERLDAMSQKGEESHDMPMEPTGWHRLLGNLGKTMPLRPSEHGKYVRQLTAAGLKRSSLPVFIGSKILLAAALPVSYLFFYGFPVEKDFTIMIIVATILGITGFLAPSAWLSRRLKQRQLQIFHELPDVLDLMTVCVEAGLSMEAAIVRIANEKHFMKSPLARELRTVISETHAGKTREEALRDFGERTMIDDIKSFATMLMQTEKLGTSLAQSLRIHSDSLRTVRKQKAEEAAAKTSVKLLFPLVFLIMPALFVVMLMPAMLRLLKVFAKI